MADPFSHVRLVLLVAAAMSSAEAQRAAVTPFTVHLNGEQLAEAFTADRRFYVPVAALLRAVQGDSAVDLPRIRVEHDRLVAVRRGGCAECPVRVRRAVVISAGLRDVARTLMIPVDDLVGAFEGRLQIDSSGRRLDIHVGRCTWCILEPSPSSALDRSTP